MSTSDAREGRLRGSGVYSGAWSTGVEEVVYRKYQDLARLAYCQMNAYKDGR